MTYAEQLEHMRDRAKLLHDCGAVKSTTQLLLVSVQYPGEETRVSLIGHAISYAMPEVWRDQGAIVTELEAIYPKQA